MSSIHILPLTLQDQVSNPIRRIGKIFVLLILIFTFLDGNQEGTGFWCEWQQALPQFLQECNTDYEV
jgi:hypothetical protein